MNARESNLRTLEVTTRERDLLLEYGYPFADEEQKLRDSKAVKGFHRVRIGAYWIELMVADLRNDRYRDVTRDFWKGGGASASDIAQRLCASGDVFNHLGRWNPGDKGQSLIRSVQKLTTLRHKYPILRRNRFLMVARSRPAVTARSLLLFAPVAEWISSGERRGCGSGTQSLICWEVHAIVLHAYFLARSTPNPSGVKGEFRLWASI